IKRLIDIVVAAAGLLLLSPVLVLAALLVRINLGAPVLFRQMRPGKDQIIFPIYKFRTMRDATDASGKPLSDGERLTGFGKWLRATSIDELPELWNILKGDMSLIGPRPLLPDYLPYYSEHQIVRHRMRPGLTGLAQVRGRNLLSWDDRLDLDVEYIRHWSLWLDFKIALMTVGVVMARRGINAAGEATMTRFDDYVRSRQKVH
ncbi:MAG TPA: sugar transferase, partial [Alphaproteobacteria bacterium]|nr:sugar transferase [Alphaproteobacteria bacterium]